MPLICAKTVKRGDLMKRVALASTNGLLLNEHFGAAKFFYIYDIYSNRGEIVNNYNFVEVRDAVAACQQSLGHSTTRFDKIIELLSDCDALFVQRIGDGAAAYLIPKNVRVFEADGRIEDILNKIISENLI